MNNSVATLSGFWGLSRHLNYVFELMLAATWSCPALGYGLYPWFYWWFLLILLVHRSGVLSFLSSHSALTATCRTFRDEEKCRAKYGSGWTEYCSQVQYRMIPFVF